MTTDNIAPALLARNEILYLRGRLQPSPGYERKLRHGINRKLQTLSMLELPLLGDKGFSVTAAVTALPLIVTPKKASRSRAKGA